MPKLALSHSSVYRYKLVSFFKSRKGKRKEARTTAANNRRYERYFPLTILLTLSCSDERTCSRKQLLKVGINQQQDYINFLWQCKERVIDDNKVVRCSCSSLLPWFTVQSSESAIVSGTIVQDTVSRKDLRMNCKRKN